MQFEAQARSEVNCTETYSVEHRRLQRRSAPNTEVHVPMERRALTLSSIGGCVEKRLANALPV